MNACSAGTKIIADLRQDKNFEVCNLDQASVQARADVNPVIIYYVI